MRVSTGIQGLDQILHGGFLPGRVYLVHGQPGAGKTTFGLHFLAAGTPAREKSLLISLGQTEANIRTDASSVGLNIDGVSILDLTPAAENFSESQSYDIFSPAEVEREPLTQEIAKTIQQKDPKRIFVDGFDHFRRLANDAFQHQRLVQSFFRFATQHGATLLIACDDRESLRDVDGVIELAFGPEGRSISITKFRGSDFRPGVHPMRISGQGIQIPGSAA
jgi:circadian clock protein KaiC